MRTSQSQRYDKVRFKNWNDSISKDYLMSKVFKKRVKELFRAEGLACLLVHFSHWFPFKSIARHMNMSTQKLKAQRFVFSPRMHFSMYKQLSESSSWSTLSPATSTTSLASASLIDEDACASPSAVSVVKKLRGRKSLSMSARVIVMVVLLLLSGLTCLYFSHRGFHRTCKFWTRMSPLAVRYRWLKWKAEYWDGVSEDELLLRLAEFHEQTAPILAEHLLEMGGIFVKLGQVLSTIGASILPAAYVEALRPFQDGIPPRPLPEIAAMIERGTNRYLYDMFSEFDETPIGAASIGQVHRAVVRDSGQEVVVKVQYSEVEELFHTDFDNIEWIVRFVNPDNLELVKSLRRRYMRELDFEVEAENIREVTRNMQAHGVEPNLIRIPRVLNETGICNQKVLVLEYLDGVPLSKAIEHEHDLMAKGLGLTGGAKELKRSLADKLKEHYDNGGGGDSWVGQSAVPRGGLLSNAGLLQAGVPVLARLLRFYGYIKEAADHVRLSLQKTKNRIFCRGNSSRAPSSGRSTAERKSQMNLSRVLKTMIHVHGLQLLKDGMYNVDPHPGNVLLLPDGRLGLIDFGAVVKLTPDDRKTIARAIVALSRGDKEETSNIYTEAGYRATFKGDVITDANILYRFASFHLDKVDLSPITTQTGEIVKIFESIQEVKVPVWIEEARRLGGLLIGTASQAARPISLSKEWKRIAKDVLSNER